MSISSESAEQMTKMLLEGTEVTLKVTGKASKELIVLMYAIIKDNKKTIGKTRLTNMLKSGKELNVFSISKDQLSVFMKEAKRYGILYTALVEKKTNSIDGMVDILVKTEDVSKINRIVERFKLQTTNSAQIKSEIEKSVNKDPLAVKTQSEKQSEKSKNQEENKKSVKEEIAQAKVIAKKINESKVTDKSKEVIKDK